MSNTEAASAWKFLRRNPAYREARRRWAAPAPVEPAPFPLRRQTEGDLEAAPWGLLAWEDPLDEAGPAAPFWTEAPTLEAVPMPGAPTLAELSGEPDVRLSGLRLGTGAVIVKVEQGEASVQVRIADGDAFDPHGGVDLLGLPPSRDLQERLRRVAALWPIGGAETKKEAAGGSRTRSFSWPSTAGSAARATA